MSIATKRGKVATYNKDFSFIKLFGSPFILSCEVILYIHLYHTNEQQTWKSGELP